MTMMMMKEAASSGNGGGLTDTCLSTRQNAGGWVGGLKGFKVEDQAFHKRSAQCGGW
jgi:hypothetical protein